MQAHGSHDPHVQHPGPSVGHGDASHGSPYRRLALMLAISFVAMYGLMYAMVDRLANVYSSWNQVYMAGVMTAAMLVIELLAMWSMYPRRGVNLALVAAGLLAGLLCWIGIRQQVGIGDAQFLRSMIPHHAGAILMCEEAPIDDAELRALCGNIIRSQQAEIAQMKALLAQRD